MKVWLDGSLVPAEAAVVPVSNHGLTVGDGMFETMKVVDGTAFAIRRHLARLQLQERRKREPERAQPADVQQVAPRKAIAEFRG